jgi:hypothetical protein
MESLYKVYILLLVDWPTQTRYIAGGTSRQAPAMILTMIFLYLAIINWKFSHVPAEYQWDMVLKQWLNQTQPDIACIMHFALVLPSWNLLKQWNCWFTQVTWAYPKPAWRVQFPGPRFSFFLSQHSTCLLWASHLQLSVCRFLLLQSTTPNFWPALQAVSVSNHGTNAIGYVHWASTSSRKQGTFPVWTIHLNNVPRSWHDCSLRQQP